jgi:L-malate glycosyltransferase
MTEQPSWLTDPGRAPGPGPSRIRIAFVIDQMAARPGGTERQLLGILERLDRNAFDPFLILLKASPWNESHRPPCEHIVLGYDGFLKPSFPGVAARLAGIFRTRRFHIVQAFFEESVLVTALAAWGSGASPVLLASRRDIGLGAGQPWYHSLYRRVFPLVYKSFDGILANCRSAQYYAARTGRFPLEKIAVIPNGVTLPDLDGPVPAVFRENPAALWIGIAANLNPVKRIDVFLECLKLLRDRHRVPDFRALILGDGPDRSRYVDMAARSGLTSQAHFLGSVPDPVAYLRHLDISVLCSDREGFSNSLLESMACGVPVVATAVGGNPELVDDSHGILVPPGNPAALAAALARLAQSPEQRKLMGGRGRQKIEAAYSWEKSMAALERYYRDKVRERASCRPGPAPAGWATPAGAGA